MEVVNGENIHVIGVSETDQRQGSNDNLNINSHGEAWERKGRWRNTNYNKNKALTIHGMNLYYQCIPTSQKVYLQE